MKSLLMLVFGFCLYFQAMAQDYNPVQLKANVSRVDLTPPLELQFSLGGYGDRMNKPAEGVHDSIWVKAVILSDGQNKYAIVTLDILALPPNVKPQVLEGLAASGWHTENLMILPSHSHTSLDMAALNNKNNLNNPYIGIYQPKLLDFVIEAIVAAIRIADTNLQPVSIGTGRDLLMGMNRNRRKNAAVDRDLTVTRIDLLNGKPLLVLANWTAHPTITSDEDMLVSAEWPGYLQRELESSIGKGVLAMYYNGAEGDQSVLVKIKSGDHYQKAEWYGREIGKKAFKIYQTIKTATESIFEYNSLFVSLPQPQMHPQFASTGGAEYGMDEQNAKYILNAMCPEKTTITALRVGDWLLVGAPGELTYNLGERIKNQLFEQGIRYPVIGGMANEWISYILSKEQYQKGGYETSVSFYGPELGPTIHKAMINVASPLID
jgi:neutral ceramidase